MNRFLSILCFLSFLVSSSGFLCLFLQSSKVRSSNRKCEKHSPNGRTSKRYYATLFFGDKNKIQPSEQQSKNRQHGESKSERHTSSFMRVTDLEVEASSSTPPLGAKPGSKGRWAQLVPGSDNELQAVFKALEKAGLDAISDESLWTAADKMTERIFRSRVEQGYPTIMDHEGTAQDSSVLMWNGIFYDSYLECDIPAIRSSGIIAMEAVCLADLLLDSSRTQLYNKFCLDRTDEILYFNDFHTESVTKVVRTKSKHPLLPNPFEFVTLMHARKLEPEDCHGEGFLIVSRAVTLSNEKIDPKASEILLNVNLIKKIDGVVGKCEMINMNHGNSPMIPTFLVKKLGADGAISFLNNIRSLCH